MTLGVREAVSLSAVGLVADVAMSVTAIASLAEGTSPTGYTWITAANISAVALGTLIGGAAAVLAARDRRRAGSRLIAAAVATLVVAAALRIVGLAVVLSNINQAQQLESISSIGLANIGTGVALAILPIGFVIGSALGRRLTRKSSRRTAMPVASIA